MKKIEAYMYLRLSRDDGDEGESNSIGNQRDLIKCYADKAGFKIVKEYIDDGFTELLGYTEDDFEAGIVFKQFVPSVEYEEVITELREKFIDKRYVSYVQEFVSKDGKPLKVVAFYKIENKLLAGHRVIKVSAAVIE